MHLSQFLPQKSADDDPTVTWHEQIVETDAMQYWSREDAPIPMFALKQLHEYSRPEAKKQLFNRYFL